MARIRKRAPAVEESIVLALFDVANHLTKKGETLAREAGMTTQQWLVLLHIAGDATFGPPADPTGVLPSEIADARGVSRANVSALVAGLAARKLVREVKDPADGRRKRLLPTAAGLRAVEQIEPLRRRANRKLLASLDPDARAALLEQLQTFLAVLRG